MGRDHTRGLTKEEVLKSREKYGTNCITSDNKNSFFKLLIESLSDPIIKILLIVLAVKTVFLFQNFDWFETLGIVIAITIASLISTLSEYGSEKAFERLQDEASKINARVYRDGTLETVDVSDLVVGDIVDVVTGDVINADGVLIKGNLIIDESSFTGETRDIAKKENDSLFRGSIVINGCGLMRVENVGLNTKYGKLASELLQKNPESPLRLKLRELANTISKIGYIGAILTFFSYLFSVIFVANRFDFSTIISIISTPKIIFGHIIYALTIAVTIIIVSVPEGLPMMIALVLSSNMKRMVKNNVLVKRMVGIETSGRIDVLFSDKTGTITEGKMKVAGFILGSGKVISDLDELQDGTLKKLIVENMLINNEVKLDSSNNIVSGNSTDRALHEYIKNNNILYKLLNRTPFSSSKKYSSVKIDDGTVHTLIKGAPDILLKNVKDYITQDGLKKKIDMHSIKESIEKYSSLGYRLILLANAINNNDYSYVASILIKDELSPSSKEAIKMINKAGIQIIMITGDAKDTGLAIAKESGIFVTGDLALTSSDLANLTDEEIMQMFPKIKLVARALPSDKSRLVKIAQSMGKIVGMTGDGVNDAPALKCADVGFAMGSGSEVSKEAADIVILDNNLTSIAKAILYGRTIFKSIRKFIIFQLTMNLCALTLSIIGPFLGIKTPVTVMQMLWINMIMDTLAGLAFSFEAPLKEYMSDPPIKKDEPIINKYMYNNILVSGLFTSTLLICFLKSNFIREIFRYDINDKYVLTAFFGLFVFSGVFNSLNARTHRINIFSHLLDNIPFILITMLIVVVQIVLLYRGGLTFRTFGLTLKEFLVMLSLSLLVIPVDIIRKIILKKTNSRRGV